MRRKLLFTLCLIGSIFVSAQNNVGINTNTPDSSAILHLESNDKGFLPPRMTDAEMNAINNPANGLTVFNNSDSIMYYYNGTCWIPTFLENCEDCLFDLSLSANSGVIDRVNSDSLTITVNVSQATSHVVNLFTMDNLPAFSGSFFGTDTISGTGSTTLTFYTSIFDNPGTYPIAVQAICNNSIQVEMFYLTIDSCYYVAVTSNHSLDYDLQSINSLPGVGTPICVVVDVFANAQITSTTATVDAYNSGALDPNSHVGLRNYGVIYAQGGDGGVGGNFTTFGTPGENGGNAIGLTCRTSIINNGFILGGGGGGASVGYGTTFNFPVIGNWTFTIGAGGGGGASDGQGGGTGGATIGYYDPGQNSGSGLAAAGGDGGILNTPISVPIGPVSININPQVYGGDGGDYGVDGTSGSLTFVIGVTIPIIGTINVANPTITNFPAGGTAGNAIKKNGNTLNGLPDGYYQLNTIKGLIGN